MRARTASAPVRALAATVSLLLTVGVLALLGPGAALADSAPPVTTPPIPTTVSADRLPTVQINGVVWSQVAVGDTVYVAGSFNRARPAGAAAGTQETVRNNLLAYDIQTGALITSFAPSLNGQALVVVASPDGSRIYVGGDFSTANGQARSRVAAYSTATGDADRHLPAERERPGPRARRDERHRVHRRQSLGRRRGQPQPARRRLGRQRCAACPGRRARVSAPRRATGTATPPPATCRWRWSSPAAAARSSCPAGSTR